MALISRCGGRPWATGIAALAFLGGCSIFGGQSGDDTGGAGCPIETRELESDSTPSSLGFSPDDVLGWAVGTRAATARWQTSGWSGISTNAADGETEVTISLARGSGPATEQTCEATRVHVPLLLDVSTADGLLEVHVPIELQAGRDGFAVARTEFAFGDMSGAFTWQSTERGVELVQPRIELALTAQGASGMFTAIRQVTSSDAVSDTAVPSSGLLVWPASSPCPADQVPLVVADADPVWTVGPASMNGATWNEIGGAGDGAPATLSLEVDASLCESAAEPPRLPARLTLRTADGVVDQRVTGHVVVSDDGVAFTNEYVKYWYTPSEFSEQVGDFGMDLAGYESISLVVHASIAGDAAQGEFLVIGSVNECESVCDENGCTGCEGSRDEVILERRFTGTPGG